MNVYDTLLLSRHPFLRTLARGYKVNRPIFELWTDASRKGYGAHLGPADQPLALFQHRSLTHIYLLPSDSHSMRSIKLPSTNTQAHEAVAFYLCLKHWRPLLRGSKIKANVDNASVYQYLSGITEASGVVGLIVDAIKTMARMEDIVLEVEWLQGTDNKLADGLSRLMTADNPRYTPATRLLMNKKDEKGEALALISSIAAAKPSHRCLEVEGSP